MKREET